MRITALTILFISSFALLFSSIAFAQGCGWAASGDYVCGGGGNYEFPVAPPTNIPPTYVIDDTPITDDELPDYEIPAEITQSLLGIYEALESLTECEQEYAKDILDAFIADIEQQFPDDELAQAEAIDAEPQPYLEIIDDEKYFLGELVDVDPREVFDHETGECYIPGAGFDLPPFETLYTLTGVDILIEAESVPPTGDWQFFDTIPGYTGTGYYQWMGDDYYSGPPPNPPLEYTFTIPEAGCYLVNITSYREYDGASPDELAELAAEGATAEELAEQEARTDLHNDYYVSVNGSPPRKEYFAGAPGEWTSARTYVQDDVFDYAVHCFDEPGDIIIEVNGRSSEVIFDSITLQQVECVPDADFIRPYCPPAL